MKISFLYIFNALKVIRKLENILYFIWKPILKPNQLHHFYLWFDLNQVLWVGSISKATILILSENFNSSTKSPTAK